MGTNLGPILTGVAALVAAFVAALSAFRPRREPDDEPDESPVAAAASEDVAYRITMLHGTIRDLEAQLELCRRNRNAADARADELQTEVEELQTLLGVCRMERQKLMQQQRRGGDAK